MGRVAPSLSALSTHILSNPASRRNFFFRFQFQKNLKPLYPDCGAVSCPPLPCLRRFLPVFHFFYSLLMVGFWFRFQWKKLIALLPCPRRGPPTFYCPRLPCMRPFIPTFCIIFFTLFKMLFHLLWLVDFYIQNNYKREGHTDRQFFYFFTKVLAPLI